MQFVKIQTPSQVNNEVLRERIERARGSRSIEYVLLIDGVESAFISFENWSDQSFGFIYEIFVLPIFRGQGLGSKLLSHAEELAKEFGCTRVELEANPFDRTISKEQLISWYTRNGYLRKIEDPERLEKVISKRKA